MQLVQLTPDLLRKVTTQLAGRYASETVARTMRWVRLTLNQAVRDRRITASPADGVRLPRGHPTEMRLLDPTEVAALAHSPPDRYSSLATPLRRGSFGRIWGKAVTESVGPPCRIHDLRHTHAAWLIADGEHPKAIQTQLGHGSIAVTMDRYGHLMDGLDDQIVLHLDARAQSAAPPARPERNRDPPGIGL